MQEDAEEESESSPRHGPQAPQSETLPQSGISPAAADLPLLVGIAQQMLQRRRSRERFFDSDLFGEPVFEILLLLFVAGASGDRMTHAEVCKAAGVPSTDGMRYVSTLIDQRLVVRTGAAVDARQQDLALSRPGFEQVARYLAACDAL
ncbi:MarR family transcriptional regulator [Sphingomonas sp. ac-8]|uniref:MarR family transcriptional regulator n=1 Tax=Sphingomonas sp. ac-8 TaxID=3242977 RepID=UPI003A7FDE55